MEKSKSAAVTFIPTILLLSAMISLQACADGKTEKDVDSKDSTKTELPVSDTHYDLGKNPESEFDKKVNECISQFETINNTVVAGCAEEVLAKKKAEDNKASEAPKVIPELDGLIDIEGGYGDDTDDSWTLSLDLGVGFNVTHFKQSKRVESFMADHLEKQTDDHYKVIMEDIGTDAGPSWTMVYNEETKQFDLEVNTYDAKADKWQVITFKKVQ